MNSLCDECKKPLPTSGDYVKCLHCKLNYHFSPCTSVGKTTYDGMNTERKNAWKCQNCRKTRSPFQSQVVPDDKNEEYKQTDDANIGNIQQKQKQQRDDYDGDGNNEENIKRFKDSLSLNSLNNKLCSVQTDITEIKTSIQTIVVNMNTSHMQIKEEIQSALATITSTLVNLTTQVSDLHNKNNENEKRINEMDKRINKLEQQAIGKNIEINNVQNKEMSAADVIKKIAASVAVDVTNNDISTAYRLKNNDRKIIVELSSMDKKRELIGKIRAHRIDSSIINKDNTTDTNSQSSNNNNNKNYIYVNEQLTPYNRRLLWQTKTRAKECNWKFVWVKNGSIFVRKIENSPAIIINNFADIEVITSEILI